MPSVAHRLICSGRRFIRIRTLRKRSYDVKKSNRYMHVRTAESHKLITTVRERENAKGKVFGYKSCRTTMLSGTNLRHFFFFCLFYVLEFDLHFASMGLLGYIRSCFYNLAGRQRKHRTVVIRCGRLHVPLVHGAVVAHERAPLRLAVFILSTRPAGQGPKGRGVSTPQGA